ncbi:MAG: nucleoside transporter C-terminal domain-containing protein [Melioribacteraceae bacterium]|nr:nucleoside transporter C-terminal domain-containing protein [Melioribacteraceae bacterium]
MDVSRIINFFGIPVLLIIAWLLSSNKKVINWHVILWGLGIEFLLALFIFVIPIGTKFFLVVNDLVNSILDSATYGTVFVFGPLALSPGTTLPTGESSIGFILAFQALATIVFFAVLVGLLYYLGIMSKVIRGFSLIFTKLMKISGAESLCVSSNIFVGVEAGLVVKPYLSKMTKSELNTILTAGMATIASSMLAVYILILRNDFPNIAGHLVSASLMNAPAAIILSKILVPETDTPVTFGKNVQPLYVKESSFFESIIINANSGAKLIVGIGAMLLAVLGLMSLVDKIFVLLGAQINNIFSFNIDWTLKGLLGYLFYPITFIIGIPLSDVSSISKIIGERLVLTEIPSFKDLSILISSGNLSSMRSAVMATYAITGFAHVASIAIFVGGYTALVPDRIKDIAKLGFSAVVGATLANLLTASIAGLFYSGGTILLGN